MVYKVTILKDLPSIPAGYSFCYEEGGRGKGPVIFELMKTVFLNYSIRNLSKVLALKT